VTDVENMGLRWCRLRCGWCWRRSGLRFRWCGLWRSGCDNRVGRVVGIELHELLEQLCAVGLIFGEEFFRVVVDELVCDPSAVFDVMMLPGSFIQSAQSCFLGFLVLTTSFIGTPLGGF
jgi:hypothetical protein